jgi:hypothetical protein
VGFSEMLKFEILPKTEANPKAEVGPLKLRDWKKRNDKKLQNYKTSKQKT